MKNAPTLVQLSLVLQVAP